MSGVKKILMSIGTFERCDWTDLVGPSDILIAEEELDFKPKYVMDAQGSWSEMSFNSMSGLKRKVSARMTVSPIRWVGLDMRMDRSEDGDWTAYYNGTFWFDRAFVDRNDVVKRLLAVKVVGTDVYECCVALLSISVKIVTGC